MPRPYGLVGNEGSYKGIGSVPGFDAYNQAVATFGADGMGTDYAPLPYMSAVNEFQANPLSGSSFNATNTLGAWVSQNTTMLVIGTVVGLLLFNKR